MGTPTEALTALRVLAESARGVLARDFGYCNGSCNDGPGDECEHDYRDVAWNLDPAAVLALLDWVDR